MFLKYWLKGFYKKCAELRLKREELIISEQLIRFALELSEGNVTKAAKFLRINRSTLQSRLRKSQSVTARKPRLVVTDGERTVLGFLEGWHDTLKTLPRSEQRHALELATEFLAERCAEFESHSQDFRHPMLDVVKPPNGPTGGAA